MDEKRRQREDKKEGERKGALPGFALLSFLWRFAASLDRFFSSSCFDLSALSSPSTFLRFLSRDGLILATVESRHSCTRNRVGRKRVAEQKALNYIFSRALHLSDTGRAESRSQKAIRNVTHLTSDQAFV